MTLVRIVSVKPLAGHSVELQLTTGEVVVRELTHLLNGPIFDGIRTDDARFRQVEAADGTLVWPGGADLCPDMVIWGGLPPSDSSSLTVLPHPPGPSPSADRCP
ncbi:MAG: DUF2442 domain-containing protein [Acidobacteria bacterium]|nr:DUF2442 domain-containing protein [Acidobacteriota bacterium]